MRLFTAFCCMAIATLLLAGCAGGPGASQKPAYTVGPLEIGNLPQMLIPGATRDEVKALAMGSARSKGWIIGESDQERLIVQRPLDANALGGLPPEIPGSAVRPGSLLEVTSYFIEQSGGVNVAAKADLVNPAPAEGTPARTDYTEAFRETLTKSLASLRATWSANRDRLARATPPAEGWKDPWGNEAKTAASEAGAAPDTASDLSADTNIAANQVSTDSVRGSESGATSKTESEPRREPIQQAFPDQPPPRPVAPPTPLPGQRIAQTPLDARPAPEPRRIASGAAPVVDASTILSTRPSAAPLTPSGRITQSSNMMTLPSDRRTSSESVTWAAYAEQYARQRGCNLTAQGTELIESRSDGEVHKIPCEGSDSFLVKCQNGTCQGLL